MVKLDVVNFALSPLPTLRLELRAFHARQLPALEESQIENHFTVPHEPVAGPKVTSDDRFMVCAERVKVADSLV